MSSTTSPSFFTQIDPVALDRRQRYRFHISALVPRPIGWVSTLSPEGVPNLAPFSFFGGLSSDPPMVYLSLGRRRGQVKDTAANIAATGEFVAHLCDESLAEKMVTTSGDYPPEVDEFQVAGLTPAASVHVGAPRVAEAPLAMECRLTKTFDIGNGPSTIFIGEVLLYHVAEGLLTGGDASFPGTVNAQKLNPVARLGGASYATLGRIFDIQRPKL